MSDTVERESPADRPVRRCVSSWAWAKVNLYLQVTGRRPDGYHEIDSLIVFAGIGDRIEIAEAEGLGLRVSGPLAAAVPWDEGNLGFRAARALRERCRPAAGASIELEKHLPVAAGLGGGSADAAAVLAGLNAHWQAALAPSVLREIALELGADVPVCLYGRPAYVAGIGERLSRAPPLPPAWLVLVNPGVALPTAEVFAARRGGFSVPGRWSGTLPDLAALAEHLAGLANDLEAPARALAPEVGEALARIGDAPGVLLARMSGSGATCFGLFAGRQEARQAAAAIAAEQPGWWVRAAPMLHGPLDRVRVPPAPA
ncbi:MAG: 4-(cytidine 5'-diphospho)-2-C-methyl-D-erythritol kinase [Kiloniellales bacterium]|nr:4-(cytidine 5'-diphospho)-2-C-methyl-D-erythritol kinase [Kiloniellales bacterium]